MFLHNVLRSKSAQSESSDISQTLPTTDYICMYFHGLVSVSGSSRNSPFQVSMCVSMFSYANPTFIEAITDRSEFTLLKRKLNY